MKILNQQIFENKEAAALPGLMESGGLPALVSGLSGIHRVNLAAALYERLELPIFVVCPDDSAAESFTRDLESMLGRPVNTLYSRDFTFYPSLAASRETEQKRLYVLNALRCGESPVTVATVSALMQRAIPPQTLGKAAFTVKDGEPCPPEELEAALLRCGYTRCEQVEGAGQFARRGGIIDFFSPAYPEPVRIEFWGDDIDSMGFFDIKTQRRTESVEFCRILPAAESLTTLASGGTQTLIDALGAAADKCAKHKSSQHLRQLEQNLRADIERLEQNVKIEYADRYMPFLYEKASGADYIPEEAIIFLDQPPRCADRAKGFAKQLGDDLSELVKGGMVATDAPSFRISWDELTNVLSEHALYMADAFTVGRYPVEPKTLVSIPAKQLPSYAGSVKTAAEDVSAYLKQGFRVVVLAGDMRRAELLQSFLKDSGIIAYVQETLEKLPEEGCCTISVGGMSAGMEYPGIKLAVISDMQLLRVREHKHKSSKKAPSNRQRINSYADLAPGDLVVHEVHGIGRFAGIKKMKVDGFEKDYIMIRYAGTDTLYVPATALDMVTKYLGAAEDQHVKLSKMGGAEWSRARSRAKAATKKLAGELIKLYAERARIPGHAFAPDSPWQREFEDNFGYTETDDQLRSINEIKADMESETPMDRLLCGDVGYGKTEVALRAAMKCILDNRQAAILVPTTVLAQQHYQTAVQRFYGFPVEIRMLSRFCTQAQVRQTLADMRTGKCDLVIGTHKLLQKNIEFKNLGLLIVDEEQRFGVAHKEHIKEMSRAVDVLTLSATPIPRTLNMALSGIRDMSTIEEPPQDRIPVQTFVMEHDWNVLCDAMRRELQRGGQVFYLHNRIENIERTALRISKMLDGAVVDVAHGQMNEEQLSTVMERMVAGETQILVCTTIIETGIDMPNVNTLIIEDADRMGLAQLHQLRGRVGRSNRRASAYLTFRRGRELSEIAEKRLSAIREFAEFNSGFRIAMRDLEIRGAGSLLGAEQSGHMIDVGYDMYLKLLEEAVLEERGEKPEQRAECAADLAVSANIPESYVPSQEQRMDLYRRIALVRSEAEADDLMDEVIDRFGDPPPSVYTLVQVALLRSDAGKVGVTDISQKNGCLKFLLAQFDMQKVSLLYARPEFKGRLKVDAGAKPGVILRLKSRDHVIEQARAFVSAWADAREERA